MLIKTLIFIEGIPDSLALAIPRRKQRASPLLRLPVSSPGLDACSQRLVYFNYTSSKQMIRLAREEPGINRVTRFGNYE